MPYKARRKAEDTLARGHPNFGHWLSRQRAQLGLTQEELSKIAGISAVSISIIENGHRPASQYHRDRLTHVLESIKKSKRSANEFAVILRREGFTQKEVEHIKRLYVEFTAG